MFRSCDVGCCPYRAEDQLCLANCRGNGERNAGHCPPEFIACLDFCRPRHRFSYRQIRRIKLPYSRTFRLAAGFVMEVQSVIQSSLHSGRLKAIWLAKTMRMSGDARPTGLLEEKREAFLSSW